MQPLADLALVVPAWSTPRIQEVQILVLHLLCELVEKDITAEAMATPLTMEPASIKEKNGKLPAYSRLFSINDNRSQK